MRTTLNYGIYAAVALAAAGKAGGTAAKSKFEDVPLAPARAFGEAGPTVNTPVLEDLEACPVGKSFLVEIDVPENVTDAKERAKAFLEGQNSRANSIKGAIKRWLSKAENAGKEVEVRKVNDDKFGRGVRIYRMK